MWWVAELTSTRGHTVQDGRYLDGVAVLDEPDRACVLCGKRPVRHVRQGVEMWDDVCIDDLRPELPLVVYDACCGHGDSTAARIRFLGDERDFEFKGEQALVAMRDLGGEPCPAT